MMILLSLLALGLLSLSSTVLRASNAGSAQLQARANARLAMTLAIGELQRTLGDDRRISADASLLMPQAQSQSQSSSSAHVVGVWESWSPKLSKNLTGTAPNYAQEKEQRFLRWLISGPEEDLSNQGWAQSPATGLTTPLFSQLRDGFDLSAPLVDLGDGTSTGVSTGSFAWAVVQENTKAKISVAGPEPGTFLANNSLSAQPRPNVGIEKVYQQPQGGWDERAAKVLDLQQARLDTDLQTTDVNGVRSDIYTANSFGLLTDVVDGGLKVDLSLGFEMGEGDFASQSWGEFTNPFHSSAETAFASPVSYGSQRPLFQPQSADGNFQTNFSFDNGPALNVEDLLPVVAVPTFNTLRSHYRIPKHLYQSTEGITVYERPADHIASPPKARPANASTHLFPGRTMLGAETQLPIRPVLDRIMFVLSIGLSSENEVNLIITPVVALWNPYNVALEIEGAVAYPWLDVPFRLIISTTSGRSSTTNVAGNSFFSGLITPVNGGRSEEPYFYAAITPDGGPIRSSGNSSIPFQPGEVRLFAPADPNPVRFDAAAQAAGRRIFLQPVNTVDQLTTQGGFLIPSRNTNTGRGFNPIILASGQRAKMEFELVNYIRGSTFPFAISLEDATLARGNPRGNVRGFSIADIFSGDFTTTQQPRFSSPLYSQGELSREPQIIGVLETVHKVAIDPLNAADLVFTGNPRQGWQNPFVTQTNFETGPQYRIRMREVVSFDELVPSINGGRNAFYGSSNSPSGETHLSMFGVPIQAPLSMAEFQHADLSMTSYAPANQFGNSWASAYVDRSRVFDARTRTGPEEFDYVYLSNESLWDRFFLSGAAPTLIHSSGSGGASVWENLQAQESVPLQKVLQDFAENPSQNPLRNSRMAFHGNAVDPETFANEMIAPQGCLKIARNLMVDGAFNVNSTSVEVWKAQLSALRGSDFELSNGQSVGSTGETPFPRLADPVGLPNNPWQGYRTLSDPEIASLAQTMVDEVRLRGPFLSLAEFVNRRVSNDQLGLKGAVQTAIDNAGLNSTALNQGENIADISSFERNEQENIQPRNTAVGSPGYLTQADVLKSLAPIITVRSDTFIVRTLGTAKNRSGQIIATSMMEAVVQRVPEFVNPSDTADTPIDELQTINATFGRRFKIVSTRFLKESEIDFAS